MRKKVIATLFAFLLIAGCIPLVQIEWVTSNDEIRISPERNQLAVAVLTSSPDQVQSIAINTEMSYAISPTGIKHKISSTQNSYANDWAKNNNSPYASFFIRLRNNNDASDTVEWSNGEWKLFLAFKNSQRSNIDSKFKLWTFWYVPLIHGPPN